MTNSPMEHVEVDDVDKILVVGEPLLDKSKRPFTSVSRLVIYPDPSSGISVTKVTDRVDMWDTCSHYDHIHDIFDLLDAPDSLKRLLIRLFV